MGAEKLIQPKSTGIFMDLRVVPWTRTSQACWLQVLLKHFVELGLRNQPNDLIHNLAALEQEQGRDSTNRVFAGGIGVVVDVHLTHLELTVVGGGDLLNHRGQRFAGSAPFRPEVHQGGLIGLQYLRLKITIGELKDSLTHYQLPTAASGFCTRRAWCNMAFGREKATVSEPLFIAQATLETWVERGEARFEDNRLTILKKNQSYDLLPAVRFTSVLDGEDVTGWLGSVKTVSQLEAAGAEHFHDSVIAGDTAYQCDVGFLGQLHAPAAAAAPQQPAAASPPPLPQRAPPPPVPAPPLAAAENPVVVEGKSEEENMRLLTEFMLKNM